MWFTDHSIKPITFLYFKVNSIMDLAKYFSLSKINPFQRIYFFRLAEKYPKVSIGLSVLIAAIGIFTLLLFPYLLITLPSDFYHTIIRADELKDWIDAIIQLILIILGGGFSWAIYKLKFSVPSGLDVSEDKFPHLIKLISELREQFGNPKIDRIILLDKFEIQVTKTPRKGMPFLSKSTLIIGLPMLQTMSPLYFRALLARRVGQLSTKHTPVTTRLYFLNDTWRHFKQSSKKSNFIFTKILSYFFQIYTPLYESILMPLMQEEELEADSYGMDLVNHQDMVECIVYEEVVSRFLKTKFWPKIYHMAKRNNTPEFLPYAQITKVVKAGITDVEISETVQAALKIDINVSDSKPTLAKRINHLGHAKPRPPKRLTQTAGEYYLGSAMEKVIQLFDKRWLSKIKAR